MYVAPSDVGTKSQVGAVFDASPLACFFLVLERLILSASLLARSARFASVISLALCIVSNFTTARTSNSSTFSLRTLRFFWLFLCSYPCLFRSSNPLLKLRRLNWYTACIRPLRRISKILICKYKKKNHLVLHVCS